VKIGFLTADWTEAFPEENDGRSMLGGSGWYRCGLPAKELALHGFETVVTDQVCPSDRGLILMDQDGVVHDDVDVIVMQRLMHESAYNLVRVAQDGGQLVVNDVDDWYWGLHPSNAAYRFVTVSCTAVCHSVCVRKTQAPNTVIRITGRMVASPGTSSWGRNTITTVITSAV
jgi:hypothetical protein